jgi:hypothetical protein
MEEWLRDPQMLREVLLRRTLRAMITAAGTLNRVARGTKFRSDEERWACLQLIRMTPALAGVKHIPPEDESRSLTHPSISPEEEAELDAILDGTDCQASGGDLPWTPWDVKKSWQLLEARKGSSSK